MVPEISNMPEAFDNPSKYQGAYFLRVNMIFYFAGLFFLEQPYYYCCREAYDDNKINEIITGFLQKQFHGLNIK